MGRCLQIFQSGVAGHFGIAATGNMEIPCVVLNNQRAETIDFNIADVKGMLYQIIRRRASRRRQVHISLVAWAERVLLIRTTFAWPPTPFVDGSEYRLLPKNDFRDSFNRPGSLSCSVLVTVNVNSEKGFWAILVAGEIVGLFSPEVGSVATSDPIFSLPAEGG